MCLIAVAWRSHPRWRLALAANRDEFHARPTLPLAPWEDDARIVGGRDLEHGGGWLALRGARLAAVTNVRRLPPPDGRSRGGLVAGFVRDDAPLDAALTALQARAVQYRPFNLLLHDDARLAMATNLPDPHPAPMAGGVQTERVPAAEGGVPIPDPAAFAADARTADPPTAAADGAYARAADSRAFALRWLEPGLHGLSNGSLDALWPKTSRLQSALAAWLHGPGAAGRTPDLAPLFDALADDTRAPDAALPDTGVGLERERWLSSAFIRSPQYGTRASTVVLIADDHALIHERRFGPDGVSLGETGLRIAR